MAKVHERFLKYVVVDTESMHDSPNAPSTEKQKDLGKILVEEMKELNIQDIYMSDEGCVYGSIPANCEPCNAPVIGFIAHMDTSPDLTGKNVSPHIIEKYDGKDIILNEEKNIIMKVSEFESLNKYIGDDIIVTDGTTLLGGDDKAGIAEIMAMAEYFNNNPDVKHGMIKIAFTPDEEVGRGTENFDIERFGADFAYTIDGSSVGEISYETFNAADAKIIINGTSIHPGASKNKMVNAILLAIELNNMLPKAEIPAHTEKREGYFHLTDFEGTVERTYLKYIIRDHDTNKFNDRKNTFVKIVNYLNEKYGNNIFELKLKDSYYNMGNKIRPVMHIVDNVKAVLRDMNIEPVELAMRGGTDGAALSYKGLPCPNIGAGYQNAHGKYEYISIQVMEKVVDLLIRAVKFYTE
jgi:tripeptide aminopeptidase